MVEHLETIKKAKLEAFIKRLESFLASQKNNVYHVLVQPYGKDKDGIRYSVVKLTSSKTDPQVLTGTYEKALIDKKTARELVSGPIGRLKQIFEQAQK